LPKSFRLASVHLHSRVALLSSLAASSRARLTIESVHLDTLQSCVLPRPVVGFSRVILAMAQKWHLEVYKPAEIVGRTKEIRMLKCAGEVLLALGLVLSSFLSYWLVSTLNGLGKFPEPQSNLKQEKGRNGPR
jgi:hypothetical protein